MLNLPSEAQMHLARESRRLTICGEIALNDGTFVRCTQHDEDIEIVTSDLAGIYLANAAVTASDVSLSSDLSVNNMEVSGFLSDQLNFTGFTVADIAAGLFNNAPFQTFMCQWDAPDAWQKIICRGYLGEIKRTSEGTFQCEWRGLLQPLQQMMGRTYSERCDVKRFGDLRCGKDVESLEVTASVTAVLSNRLFDVELDTSAGYAVDYFTLGEAAWLTGLNAGYERQQVKRGIHSTSGDSIELWEEMPNAVQVGDTVRLRPGCNRTWEACQFWENTRRFRGHGRWMPGIPNIIRAP